MDIRSIMKPPQTVSPDEYATKIRAILREKERIIFVSEDNRLLNVITQKDAMLVTSTKSNLKAREIMSYPVLTLAPDEEIHVVGRKMIEKDTYSAPVMEGSFVLGVVHMDDILQAVYRPSPKKVGDIMTTQVISCDRTEEITRVWNLMEMHNFSGLPITEEVSTSRRRYDRLAGMVTRKDILRAGEIRPGGDRKRFTSPPPVEKVMTRTPKYVHPRDSVDLCVKLFRTYRIGRLPVVGDGFELVGIVDREDILQLYV
jgi:CBS domain-containing protein